MRFVCAILTFAIGITAAGFVSNLFDYAPDSVPEVVVTTTVSRLAQSDTSEPKFVPFFETFRPDEGYWGWFVTEEFEGMSDVWTIQLSRDRWDDDDNHLSWYAFVRTADPITDERLDYVSDSMVADRDRLSFATQAIRGIHYKFEGRFLYGGSTFAQDEKVLKGRLVKFQNGKRVAQLTATFEYAEPYCTQ